MILSLSPDRLRWFAGLAAICWIALAEARDVFAGGDDGSGQFVAGHMRQVDIAVVPHPAVEVRAAQARRLDLDHHAAGRWRGIGEDGHNRRLAELFVINGAHA